MTNSCALVPHAWDAGLADAHGTGVNSRQRSMCGNFSAMRRLTTALTSTLFILAAALGLGVFPGVAAAQDPVLAAEVASFDGYYIEDGGEENFGELDDLAARANSSGNSWYFVSLFEPAETGNSFFADEVFQYVDDPGTVIVVSPSGDSYEVGISSSDYSASEIDAALDRASQKLTPGVGDSYDRLNTVFAELSSEGVGSLSGSSSNGSASDGSAREESSSAVPLLVGVVGVGGLVGGGVWWSRRKSEKAADERDEADIVNARNEIKAQVDVVANKILDQSNAIEMSENAQAISYYREASATFSAVDDQLNKATSLLELADLNDDIDLARWKMEAALAITEGRPVPPEPEPDKSSACFFDPTHRPGTETCTVNTAAGGKAVNVCEDCAAKLRKGERPDPRMIEVHGQRVPAARAPRSHGGLGMGGLDIFDIVLGGGGLGRGGFGQRQRRRGGFGGGGFGRGGSGGGGFGNSGTGGGMFEWGGGQRTTTRRTGGVFGPDRIPRSSPNRQRPASKRRSSSSASSSRRSGPSRSGSRRRSSGAGRGRRRM